MRAWRRSPERTEPDVNIAETDILLVVDVQNDFCAGGALAVPDGEAVTPVINRLAPRFTHVALTQDWHPPGHTSFASSHPGKRPHELFETSYGPQVLWPDHCVQDTAGAALRADLDVRHVELILRKGFHRQVDSYSAFFENDRKTATGLAGYLRERGFSRIFLAGLALDFCVLGSAEDARSHGFEAVVIDDACRAIDLDGSAADARRRFAEAGADITTSDQIA